MYIRKWNPSQDNPVLIDLVVNNFQVKKEVIQLILGMANEVMVVCDSNDQIVGFVSYRFRLGNMIYVDYVVLDTKHQGKGIGSQFAPVFEKHLLQQGIQMVFGSVDVENTEALKVFQRWGFEVQGQIGSNIIIQKSLSGSVSTQPNLARRSSNIRRLSSPPSLGLSM
ncbi:GNAT family N-acetyltransferase [Fictibacillus phosphorivorans]|uniref:GNAT family N-acetyltransferase n=1 Tax=Fictibacillus phosphorivorans TaxID=1221500 RepID=UPI00203DF386|nr:GNAT family N-acetyltransferase [Fictibacillus phosphorivorans]MCM3719555.1 GNAT family N-acetyltransferase [Fictibacillus phosphorivorans]MCM3777246.1 GNAT family N-acetyltransferase [Fictibacillus phosphorivorans]